MPFHVNQLIGFGVSERVRGTIQFVGGKVASKTGATSGNSTLALNSGLTGGIASSVSSGDMVVAVFAVGSDLGNQTALLMSDGTTDYTLIGSQLKATGYTYCYTILRLAYKFVGADTDTTFGPTQALGDAGAMAVYAFRGVDTEAPLDVSATTVTVGNFIEVNPPAITPVTPGAIILSAGAGSHYRAAGTYTSPDLTDFQTIFQDETDTDSSFGIGLKEDWVSGSFDPAAWTFSAGLDFEDDFTYAAMTIALRPA
jgi:hypothetical protein